MDSNPLESNIVPFYGDELIAVERPDGTIFVLFSRLCENLGLSRRSQTERVSEHAVLSQGLQKISVRTSGGPQTLQCLRLDLLPLWLSQVQVNRVKEELRPKLERYQFEVATVLWNHFRPRIDQRPIADDSSITALRQIAENARAIALLAEQQIELQQRQQRTEHRLDQAAHVVQDMRLRLGVLEEKLQPATLITEEQATIVSNTVKALAELLTTKDAAKNHYQGIFAELYRRFGVSSYKNIRQGQYQTVLNFLEDWRKAADKATSQAVDLNPNTPESGK